MKMKKQITITIDKETLKKIDDSRGLIPRALYINTILKAYFNQTHMLNKQEVTKNGRKQKKQLCREIGRKP